MEKPVGNASEDCLRLLGRLAAGVAHDLNNYLVVLDVALSLLERGDDPIALRHAQTAVDAAIRLTGTLLVYARGGSPEPAPVELAMLVRRTLKVISSSIPSNVRVDVELDDTAPPVRAVATELEQVVLNLVLNACDAMPKGGDLRIRVEGVDAERVRLEIADRGTGLVPPTRDARTLSSKTGRIGGGLGLGIVMAVTERHGADMSVSPRDGGGTVVSILLPVG
jgi:signal transduction histidine kinase